MDRDPSENHLDPVERETPSTGQNDTGEIDGQAVRVMKNRRKKGTAPAHGSQTVRTKTVPSP